VPTKLQEWEQLPENDKLLINFLNKVQEELGYIPHYRLTELAK
jgi:NADH:ubiquinone oxidoreductase subunit E